MKRKKKKKSCIERVFVGARVFIYIRNSVYNILTTRTKHRDSLDMGAGHLTRVIFNGLFKQASFVADEHTKQV